MIIMLLKGTKQEKEFIELSHFFHINLFLCLKFNNGQCYTDVHEIKGRKRAEKVNYVTRDWFSLNSFIRSDS